jgi:hypothetical protein
VSGNGLGEIRRVPATPENLGCETRGNSSVSFSAASQTARLHYVPAREVRRMNSHRLALTSDAAASRVCRLY